MGDTPRFKEASYYKQLSDKKVRCMLCPHNCIIGNGETGRCKVKQNVDGNLKAMNYNKLYLSKHQQIEQTGFFHFLPGSDTLLISSPGENLRGWNIGTEISNKEVEDVPVILQTAGHLSSDLKKKKTKVLCYGYTEPMMFYEYMEDIMNQNKDIKHVIQTRGFVEQEPIRIIGKRLKAAIVEVPSMTEGFYENLLKASLIPILKSMKILHDNGTWIEVVMPLYPEIHNSLYDIRKLIAWMLNNLGENVPLHFVSRQQGSEALVKHARKIAMSAGMHYVYAHAPGFEEGINTFCPNCEKPVISRDNGEITKTNLSGGKCSCGKEISGIWQ